MLFLFFEPLRLSLSLSLFSFSLFSFDEPFGAGKDFSQAASRELESAMDSDVASKSDAFVSFDSFVGRSKGKL